MNLEVRDLLFCALLLAGAASLVVWLLWLEHERGIDHGYERGFEDGYTDGFEDGLQARKLQRAFEVGQ